LEVPDVSIYEKGVRIPVLTRQTTYSSLPPSPRVDGFDRDIQREGVGVDIEDVLDRLGEGEGEVYWEAEDNGVDREREREEMRSPSPEVGLEEKEGKGGISLWDLLRDEAGAEEWEGWIADGKWYVLIPSHLHATKVESDALGIGRG
jgi:hypothetical protein